MRRDYLILTGTWRVKCRMLSAMSDWANELVEVFAESMRKRRTELALSAQKLEDRTASIGHKVTKAVISDLETGRRKRLYLPDALVIAEALNTSLATLLYPGMPDRGVEQVPGRLMPSWNAALSLIGIEPLFGDIKPDNEHEHETGHALARASAFLEEEREVLLDVTAEFMSQDQHLDAEGKAHFLQLIRGAERRVAEAEGRIRELGGVVDNEFIEGLKNG